MGKTYRQSKYDEYDYTNKYKKKKKKKKNKFKNMKTSFRRNSNDIDFY